MGMHGRRVPQGRGTPSGRVAPRHLARQVAGLFRPYRGQASLAITGIVISSAIGIVNPLLIKQAFDALFPPHAGAPNLSRLYVIVAIMVAVPMITAVIGIGQTYITNRVGQRVMQDLRNTLYEHLQNMSLRYFTGTRTGEIQSRLTNDVGDIQTVVTDTASSILSNVVILTSTIIAMVVMSWQLTVLSLAMVPVFLLLTYRAGNARRRISGQTQDSKAEMTAITEETLSVSGMLLTKAFGRKDDEIRRFREENSRLADLAIRREMIGRGLFAIVQVFFSSAPALVYLVAGVVISRQPGTITAGTIVAFTTLQTRLFFPIGQMLQVSVEVQGSLALFERIFDYLKMEHDIVEPVRPVAVAVEAARGAVRLRNVSFRYDALDDTGQPVPSSADDAAAAHSRQWALRDVSLEVAPGQLAAIVGPSGAGKTTISYLVPRLYDVTEGAVELDGVDVRRLSLRSLSDIIGMVTQETYLFHATVRRNLLYARPDATQEEMIAAARAAFIHDRIMELADGYDTLVGERGYRMSGGEKQRLAIARVALKAPRVLILDEATSALDTTSERLVQAALRPLMGGRTTIAIAHRLSTILAADVIFVLERGRLVEQGTHAELLGRSGLYAELYQEQFQGGRVEALCEDGVVLADGDVVGNQAAS